MSPASSTGKKYRALFLFATTFLKRLKPSTFSLVLLMYRCILLYYYYKVYLYAETNWLNWYTLRAGHSYIVIQLQYNLYHAP